jgi:hypothetical protein
MNKPEEKPKEQKPASNKEYTEKIKQKMIESNKFKKPK